MYHGCIGLFDTPGSGINRNRYTERGQITPSPTIQRPARVRSTTGRNKLARGERYEPQRYYGGAPRAR